MFEDGYTILINGRHLKSVRRYWQKVRTKVKPPDTLRAKPSRHFQQIADKERRQIDHALHIISKDFVRRCYKAGVDEGHKFDGADWFVHNIISPLIYVALS